MQSPVDRDTYSAILDLRRPVLRWQRFGIR